MTNVILDNTGLCNSNTISCNEFLSEIAGITVWISYAGDVREAIINDPNAFGVAAFSGACSACSATTTTTTTAAPATTTTTTSAPTTTTTSAPVCKEYQITSTDPTYGADISGTLCDGTPYSDTGFFGTVNICFLEYTLSVAGGTFSLIGDCSTTTTTTAAPTTTTTTLAPSGTFIVKNTSGNGQIDDVTTTGGAYFYFFNTGNFPLTTGQQADGGGASLTGADIFVDISNFSSTSCLSLYVNSGLIGQLEVSGNGTYTFTNKTFTSSDDVLIELVSGACP
jgi:hypothetical protein